jgi:molecular chaperone GrpE (heat shock protein)
MDVQQQMQRCIETMKIWLRKVVGYSQRVVRCITTSAARYPAGQEQCASAEPTRESLLKNSAFMALVEQQLQLMKRLEAMQSMYAEESVKVVLEQIQADLHSALEIAGAQRIEVDTRFDPLRHEPVPMRIVATGVPIITVLEPGLIIENRVLKKARVQVTEINRGSND